MMELPREFLRGSYCPLLTPYTRDGAVDYGAYGRLVERQIRAGTHGIVVGGTTGEPSLLTLEERKQLLEMALRMSNGQLPVVAATGSQSFDETLELSTHAERVGASALLIVTPYYVRPPQRGLVTYYSALAARTSLPMLIYHIPGRAAVGLTIDTLLQIAAGAPNLVGIKHAHSDLGLVTEAQEEFGAEFRIFAGLEELSFPMLALGACGMVNAVSNIAPQRVAELYEASRRGDLIAGRGLHRELMQLNRAVFFDTNPIPIKYMAKRMGILAHDHHRSPLAPPTSDVARRLDRVLEESGLLGNPQEKAPGAAATEREP